MNRPKARVRIVDRAALEEVVRWLEATGRWPVGVSQPTRSRLVNRKLKAISAGTYEQLLTAIVPPRDRGWHVEERKAAAALDAAIRNPNELLIEFGYRDWLHRRTEEFFFRRETRYDWLSATEWGPVDPQADVGPATVNVDIGPNPLSGAALLRYQNFNALLRRLDGIVVRNVSIGDRLRDLLRQVGASPQIPDDPSRSLMTLLRIVGPLLEGPESAFVEVQWEELSDEAIGQYVLAGIQREKVLLGVRGETASRINRIATNGPRRVERLRKQPVRRGRGRS